MSKIYKSLRLIKTKYVFFAEDDDFVFKSGLKESEKFLNKNKSFVSSSGILFDVGLYYVDILKTFVVNLRNHKDNRHFYLKSFNDKNQNKRLLNQINSDHFTIWNSLHKTSIVRDIFKDLSSLKLESYLLTEHFFNYAINLKGKIHRGKYLQYFKIDNILNSSSYEYEQKIGGYEKQFQTNFWNNDLKKVINRLLNYIQKKEKINYHNLLKEDLEVRHYKFIVKNKTILMKIKKIVLIFIRNIGIKKFFKNIKFIFLSKKKNRYIKQISHHKLNKYLDKCHELKLFYDYLIINKEKIIKLYNLDK